MHACQTDQRQHRERTRGQGVPLYQKQVLKGRPSPGVGCVFPSMVSMSPFLNEKTRGLYNSVGEGPKNRTRVLYNPLFSLTY